MAENIISGPSICRYILKVVTSLSMKYKCNLILQTNYDHHHKAITYSHTYIQNSDSFDIYSSVDINHQSLINLATIDLISLDTIQITNSNFASHTNFLPKIIGIFKIYFASLEPYFQILR